MRRRDRKRIVALAMAAALMMSQFGTAGNGYVYAQEAAQGADLVEESAEAEEGDTQAVSDSDLEESDSEQTKSSQEDQPVAKSSAIRWTGTGSFPSGWFSA